MLVKMRVLGQGLGVLESWGRGGKETLTRRFSWPPDVGAGPPTCMSPPLSPWGRQETTQSRAPSWGMGTRWGSGQEFTGLSVDLIFPPAIPLSEFGSGIKNGLEGQLEEAGDRKKTLLTPSGKAMRVFSGYSI